ncbi:MAG TPA: Hsp70 family protein, partial [Kineosporiaceae bacterium]
MYTLGIDMGTTYSAAAVWRDGRAEICGLGTHTAAVPSVVLVRADGTVLTGEAAARRAVVEPDRVAREFKRRLGDATPLLLGGVPYRAEQLMAEQLRALVAAVTEREGEAPHRLTVSHPANWGPFKTDLLGQAVALAGVRVPVSFLTEPEAAAVSYARRERLAAGETVAVYDLGGGTFDAAVLRHASGGFAILGHPEGIERLGGIDIDAAVFGHVARAVGAPLVDLDEDDAAAVAAVGRLRAECVAAKEALSTDLDTVIPVLLPGYSGEVRLTRAELEAIVRPSLYDSIEALRRALRSADVQPDELAAVLLVGGSSRMPLVAELVSAELGRPVAVDAHPKHAIALGAAWVAGEGAGGGSPREAPTPAAGVPAGVVGVPVVPGRPAPAAPPILTAPVSLAQAPQQSSRPVDRSVPLPPPPGGVQILRPAGAPDGGFGAFAPPGPTPAYPVYPPVTPATGRPAASVPGSADSEDDASRRDRRAAMIGGLIGAEAGVAGILGYEQGQSAGVSAGSAAGAPPAGGAGAPAPSAAAGPGAGHAAGHGAGHAAGPGAGHAAGHGAGQGGQQGWAQAAGPTPDAYPAGAQALPAPSWGGPAGRKIMLTAPRSLLIGAATAVATAVVVFSGYAALHAKKELVQPLNNTGGVATSTTRGGGSETVVGAVTSAPGGGQGAAGGGGGGAAPVPPADQGGGGAGGGGRTTSSTRSTSTTATTTSRS